ncbi:Do family serine endopeptidase [Pseudomonadota bacterium]|nr:Do family serine endopeptidase [Pseudomonadota bacterium]
MQIRLRTRKLIKYFIIYWIIFFISRNAFTNDQALPHSAKLSLAPMIEQVTPSVVNISSQGEVQLKFNPLLNDPFFRRFFNFPGQTQKRRTQSLGSGVIVDSTKGLIITNSHVVRGASEIQVKLMDGRVLKGKLVGSDAETDIAVVQIPAKDLVSIPISNSDLLKVGDFVVAIGNPFGLGQTVTSGIVSALARSGLGITGYEDLIQTDASINPGNSGGALVDLDGKLVGINTAIFSKNGGNIGIGFAIPTNMVQKVLAQLVQFGGVERGYFGAKFQNLDPQLVDAFAFLKKKGAMVVKIVRGSPAEDGGLKVGDLITKAGGKIITSAADLRNQLGLIRPGAEVSFEYFRGQEMNKTKIKIARYQDALRMSTLKNDFFKNSSVVPIPSSSSDYGQIDGVMISNLDKDSTIWASGLRTGDIISSVNKIPIGSVADFVSLVQTQNERILLKVHRNGSSAYVMVE